MPRQDFTDTTIILDRSGSMESIKPGIIKGFNQFVTEQKAVPGDGCWTLVQFAEPNAYSVTYRTIPQENVEPLSPGSYQSTGHSTALVDAVCRTIHEAIARLAGVSEADYPSGVLFVIVTDGLENASTAFSRADMNSLIAAQKEKYNWQFIFLAANQDAVAEARQMGIGAAGVMNYRHSSEGAQAAYASASAGVRAWKLAGNDSAKELLLSAAPDDKLVSKTPILPGDPDAASGDDANK